MPPNPVFTLPPVVCKEDLTLIDGTIGLCVGNSKHITECCVTIHAHLVVMLEGTVRDLILSARNEPEGSLSRALFQMQHDAWSTYLAHLRSLDSEALDICRNMLRFQRRVMVGVQQELLKYEREHGGEMVVETREVPEEEL